MQDFDPVAVRVADEEAICSRNPDRLVDPDAAGGYVGPGRGDVRDVQAEVPRADRVPLGLEQEVQVRPAEVVPESHEVEAVRGGDLAQAELLAVESPAGRHVRDDHRAVVDVRNGKAHPGYP